MTVFDLIEVTEDLKALQKLHNALPCDLGLLPGEVIIPSHEDAQKAKAEVREKINLLKGHQ